jgi:hypothetical protein
VENLPVNEQLESDVANAAANHGMGIGRALAHFLKDGVDKPDHLNNLLGNTATSSEHSTSAGNHRQASNVYRRTLAA